MTYATSLALIFLALQETTSVELDPAFFFRIACNTMNEADRNLFKGESLGAAVAGQIGNAYPQLKRNAVSFPLLMAFGAQFAALPNAHEPADFAPGARQRDLLRSAFLQGVRGGDQMTTTQAAGEAGVHPSYIKAEITRGKLEATRIGVPGERGVYVIRRADFEAWQAARTS
jgi:hypothetical protein